MIKLVDNVGDEFHLRPEAVHAICIPSVDLNCKVMLGGTVFLIVSREAAETLLKELEKADGL